MALPTGVRSYDDNENLATRGDPHIVEIGIRSGHSVLTPGLHCLSTFYDILFIVLSSFRFLLQPAVRAPGQYSQWFQKEILINPDIGADELSSVTNFRMKGSLLSWQNLSSYWESLCYQWNRVI